jgi:DNA-binding IclR family transcriptional regulator
MFSRGQRRSLFRGAISKIILAHLPHHQLRSIFSRNQSTIEESKLGADWPAFRDILAAIRKDGYCVSYGEFNPGVVGIAAPVFNREHLILGSVGIAFGQEELKDVDVNRAVVAVKRAAREITQRMENTTIPGMDLPPRAVG